MCGSNPTVGAPFNGDFMQEHNDSLKWIWLMDWCKSNRFNPANQYYWKLAEEAYITNKRIEAASCGKRGELDKHSMDGY